MNESCCAARRLHRKVVDKCPADVVSSVSLSPCRACSARESVSAFAYLAPSLAAAGAALEPATNSSDALCRPRAAGLRIRTSVRVPPRERRGASGRATRDGGVSHRRAAGSRAIDEIEVKRSTAAWGSSRRGEVRVGRVRCVTSKASGRVGMNCTGSAK